MRVVVGRERGGRWSWICGMLGGLRGLGRRGSEKLEGCRFNAVVFLINCSGHAGLACGVDTSGEWHYACEGRWPW